jgi:glycosyltransferase involved in cell wall biosynthesis
MTTSAKSPIFIGPLPPPVHGFSEITRLMLADLRQHSDPWVLNMSPSKRGMWFESIAIAGQILQLLAVLIAGRYGHVYLALSGGKRQVIDTVMGALCHAFGRSVVFHHHSFAYLNRPSRLTKLLMFAVPRGVHITLCEHMRQLLIDTYRVPAAQVKVVSNVAFLSLPYPESDSDLAAKSLRIAYLSYVTREKGAIRFIECIRALEQAGVAVEGVIAGPVALEFRDEFESRLSGCKSVRYVGPVYGDEKAAFLSASDVLLFPTEYVNEAEPVTIFEAQAKRLAVIALKRGCIEAQIPEGAGYVFEDPSQFAVQAAKVIMELALDRSALERMKKASRASYEQRFEAARQSVAEMLAYILQRAPLHGLASSFQTQ